MLRMLGAGYRSSGFSRRLGCRLKGISSLNFVKFLERLGRKIYVKSYVN